MNANKAQVQWSQCMWIMDRSIQSILNVAITVNGQTVDIDLINNYKDNLSTFLTCVFLLKHNWNWSIIIINSNNNIIIKNNRDHSLFSLILNAFFLNYNISQCFAKFE